MINNCRIQLVHNNKLFSYVVCVQIYGIIHLVILWNKIHVANRKYVTLSQLLK